MDIFGVIFVATLPAIGGGTVRDLLLGLPVHWLDSQEGLLLAALAAVMVFFSPKIWVTTKTLVWFDAVGLSVFAVVGASVAYDLGHGAFVTIIMGVITATAGGLLRDVVCNKIPLLLKEDVYATAAIVGICVFYGARLANLDAALALLIGGLTVFTVRASSVVFGWALPAK
ncbi:UNVERIFIED_CONTAM: hypothetical protein GTU68_038123 [Idotea baltica]|nr:hypothetical protein [Idotea baltica]